MKWPIAAALLLLLAGCGNDDGASYYVAGTEASREACSKITKSMRHAPPALPDDWNYVISFEQNGMAYAANYKLRVVCSYHANDKLKESWREASFWLFATHRLRTEDHGSVGYFVFSSYDPFAAVKPSKS